MLDLLRYLVLGVTVGGILIGLALAVFLLATVGEWGGRRPR